MCDAEISDELYTKLIDEELKNMVNDYIEFEGFNCMYWSPVECLGWDGISKRCDCGNRRVYWEPEKNSLGWYIRAVAY